MYKPVIIVLLLLVMSVNGQKQREILKEELFQRSDIKVEEVNPGMLKIEYADKKIGYKNINDFPEAERYIYNDSTIIDLNTVDTVIYGSQYRLWQAVPLSNFQCNFIRAGDVNGNGKMELYGTRKQPTQNYEATNVYELDDDGIFKRIYVYPLDHPQAPNTAHHKIRNIADIDSDGKPEVHITHGFSDSISPGWANWDFHQEFYKKPTDTSLATELAVRFVPYPFEEGQQLEDMTVGNFDKDEKTDLVFARWTKNNDIDFFEYNSPRKNFDSIFVSKIPPNGPNSASGFAIGDFDMDGNLEFVLGTGKGNVHIYENYGNNQYRYEWGGMVETYHAYSQTSTKDLDGNGKDEIWVMGDAFYSGVPITRITLFETSGINSYQAVAKIDLIGAFSSDAYNLQSSDIDKDGKEEVLVCISGRVMILKFEGRINEHKYGMFFYKRMIYFDMITITFGAFLADLTKDGREELIVSYLEIVDSVEDAAKFISRIYKPDFPLSVIEEEPEIREYSLYQNYPNPFNPNTKIRFRVPVTSYVQIKIFNVLGEEIRMLIEKEMQAGEHFVDFDASDLSAGVYIYRLEADGFIQNRKMVLIK